MPLGWCDGHDGQNATEGTVVNATLSQMMKSQIIAAAATSEWSDQTTLLLLQSLQLFGVHEASWLHCELCSQSRGHLHYTNGRLYRDILTLYKDSTVSTDISSFTWNSRLKYIPFILTGWIPVLS